MGTTNATREAGVGEERVARCVADVVDAPQPIAAGGEERIAPWDRARFPLAVASAHPVLLREVAAFDKATTKRARRGNGLSFVHAAELAQGVAAETRTAFVFPVATDGETHGVPIGIEGPAQAAIAFRPAHHDAAALIGVLACLVVGVAADGPICIVRGLAGEDPLRAALVGARAMLGQRQTGLRPALAVEAAEPVTARELARTVATERAIGATDRFADVVDAFVPFAAVVRGVALPEWLAADATGAHPLAAVARTFTECSLGAATPALPGL